MATILQSAQASLNAGYGKLANAIGQPSNIYRASGVNDPVSNANLIANLSVRLDPSASFSATVVSSYNKPILYAAIDRTGLLVGDYIVQADTTTVFINAMQDIVPTSSVLCNEVISIYRPAAAPPTPQAGGVPYNNYNGDTANNGKGDPLAMNWPASVLQGPKGERSELQLPNDIREPWVAILMPAIPGVSIQTTDQFFTADGRRYVISSVELTRLGYRLTADDSGV